MKVHTLLATAVVGVMLTGCGKSEEQASAPSAPTTADTTWLLASMPDGAVEIAALKATAKAGDEVVMRGTIGGRKDPMTAGLAVFVVMDTAIPSCADMGEDHCATPWDYCCESKESIIANNATVQLVGADGRVLDLDLTEHGFALLDEVVVVGTVEPRPSDDILIIKATGIHRVDG